MPYTGNYKVELWGGEGGQNCNNTNSSNTVGKALGGYGGYTAGTVLAAKSTNIYVYVGQKGPDCSTMVSGGYTAAGWNGGGRGRGAPDNNDGSGSGGGATDIRVVSGNWDNADSLRSRIIVAGAGSGASAIVGQGGTVYRVSSGGGLTGVGNIYEWTECTTSNHSFNATQTSGYAFGKGQDGYSAGDAGSGAGGSGWYGGLATNDKISGSTCTSTAVSGGSGSSYISGHTGSVAVTSKSSSSPKSGCTTGTTNNACSISPYGYTFTNTVMIDGLGYKWTNTKGSLQAMPKPAGGTYASGTGHSGNGYARITWLGTNV